MKLITLNTWGGRVGQDKFHEFFARHSDTDIFCLQEVWNGGEEMGGKVAGGRVMKNIWHSMMADLTVTLSDYQPFFCNIFRGYYGLAMFVRKGVTVSGVGEHYVYREKGYISELDPGDHGRCLQFATIGTPQGDVLVTNLHGAWRRGVGHVDFDDRILQSDNIVRFVADRAMPAVLAGDFNLGLETESVRRLEQSGLRNLVREYGALSTRTPLYDRYTDNDLYADYILTSPSIPVHNFAVLPDQISDHSPLVVEFA